MSIFGAPFAPATRPAKAASSNDVLLASAWARDNIQACRPAGLDRHRFDRGAREQIPGLNDNLLGRTRPRVGAL